MGCCNSTSDIVEKIDNIPQDSSTSSGSEIEVLDKDEHQKLGRYAVESSGSHDNHGRDVDVIEPKPPSPKQQTLQLQRRNSASGISEARRSSQLTTARRDDILDSSRQSRSSPELPQLHPLSAREQRPDREMTELSNTESWNDSDSHAVFEEIRDKLTDASPERHRKSPEDTVLEKSPGTLQSLQQAMTWVDTPMEGNYTTHARLNESYEDDRAEALAGIESGLALLARPTIGGLSLQKLAEAEGDANQAPTTARSVSTTHSVSESGVHGNRTVEHPNVTSTPGGGDQIHTAEHERESASVAEQAEEVNPDHPMTSDTPQFPEKEPIDVESEAEVELPVPDMQMNGAPHAPARSPSLSGPSPAAISPDPQVAGEHTHSPRNPATGTHSPKAVLKSNADSKADADLAPVFALEDVESEELSEWEPVTPSDTDPLNEDNHAAFAEPATIDTVEEELQRSEKLMDGTAGRASFTDDTLSSSNPLDPRHWGGLQKDPVGTLTNDEVPDKSHDAEMFMDSDMDVVRNHSTLTSSTNENMPFTGTGSQTEKLAVGEVKNSSSTVKESVSSALDNKRDGLPVDAFVDDADSGGLIENEYVHLVKQRSADLLRRKMESPVRTLDTSLEPAASPASMRVQENDDDQDDVFGDVWDAY